MPAFACVGSWSVIARADVRRPDATSVELVREVGHRGDDSRRPERVAVDIGGVGDPGQHEDGLQGSSSHNEPAGPRS